ncbi:JNK-interacting protein 1 isoform X2 [Toxorhynchites rutilus septentrionalis]|uniref:JNK-interacting protein 1 isoform X2 n=1 Tax=Toxorhynchites rutilus septentrionalis TaxID=329112 RepID=UPI00247A4AEA|nr:JNK-interacting protein 1 isoform X2 [Toxorhynchites rutilus septentrionalis]
MADADFEEFRQNLDKLPTYSKTPVPFYSLVSDVDLDEDTPSTKSSDASDHEDLLSDADSVLKATPSKTQQIIQTISTISSSSAEDDEIGDGLKTITNFGALKSETKTAPGGDSQNGTTAQDLQQALCNTSSSPLSRTSSLPWIGGQSERRRRKLPEIPKNRKSSVLQLISSGQTSLADELSASKKSNCSNAHQIFMKQNSLLALKCSYLLDEDSSPDSERLQSLGDVDSGHSTAHSPNDFKSMSPPAPQAASPLNSPFPPPYGGVPFSQLEMLESTHRGLHKFVPRHHDEIDIEIGDPIYVQKEAEDLWCEGVNLRTGRQGIFPSAYAVDLDYNDFDPSTVEMKRERYLLGYLGSVETLAHKGTAVVCQAVRKIVGDGSESPKAQACILEISDQGLRMVDRSRSKKDKRPCIDYFYSLKNVSFCAFHPRDHRYIGFITKHPTVQRFACHVFQGTESTRPVAEAVGRAFQRFYQKFIETAYPIEDIYIE